MAGLRLVRPQSSGLGEAQRRLLSARFAWELADDAPKHLDVQFLDVRHVSESGVESTVFILPRTRFPETVEQLVDVVEDAVLSDARLAPDPARYSVHFIGDHGEKKEAAARHRAHCAVWRHEEMLEEVQRAVRTGRAPKILERPLPPDPFVPLCHDLGRVFVVVRGGLERPRAPEPPDRADRAFPEESGEPSS